MKRIEMIVVVAVIVVMLGFETKGSGVPIVGLSEEQLQRLRDVPGVEVSVNALREERDIPPDIEVEWKVVESASPKFSPSVTAIFINSNQEIRVVAGYPRYIRGKKVWLSKDMGKTWVVEKYLKDAWTDRAALLGEEAGKIIFRGSGGRPYSDWPRETESLIKERFIRCFRHYERVSGVFLVFARDQENSERLFFSASLDSRLFVSLDNGKNWIEISAPRYATVCSVAISSRGDKLRLWVGTNYKDLLQCAVLDRKMGSTLFS